nr:immunoglobulin light chain junction region [Macaca mulatta]MOX08794.1 immunoglobulin light chain junction region [Macaca mulatta]MOX09250.1 immunoglobulin light chain junction region [Macaca mulatta]MOX10975.1 immunoglobulin light chain junction region [Macaca mulatta]MOX51653.1 immunoglobulin light chain junction region [Macaca mulatta]
CLQALEFPFTF